MHELLQRTVRLHGVQIGRVVDVILDEAEGEPIGLEVRCEDGMHRFLPLAAASETEDGLVVESPFALLDSDELEFYRARGTPLRGRRDSAA
jgi:PRC-barrel domain protein